MQKVCVIGAGSSGIAACQVLAERGIAYDCFELGSDVGGNWRYLNDNGRSSAYRSLHINTSRQIMEYASFPMSDEYPVYPGHAHIARYFDAFVDHFGLRPSIRFRTEVVEVAPAGDTWAVTSRPRGTNDHETGTYDAVLVANGHHWKPRWPRPGIAGATDFEGTQIHSHDYRVPEPFADRRVLVLGIGNSACDIAVETSRVSRRTFLAMRRGAHILPKHLFGTPTDHLTHSWLAKAPLAVQDRGLQLLLRLSRGRLADYGLPTPAHRVLAAHPTISDDLLSRLSHGDITVKPAPRKADADHVFFDDGSVEEIDTIIYCTGYDIAFPFLKDELIGSGDNDPGLYRRVAAPDRPGLYFIGLIQPLGAIMPLAEAQSHWVADLLEGRCALPGREEMLDEIRTYRARTARRYVASTRHTIQVDAQAYLRELAKERRRRAVPR
ncbi:NAD(P)-binding domain-containing protein [Streptomyces sp. SLBN-115]|uniref:NAD(P)-binding domain-containing protein n=1 Tax=Streptomyces sp. SLBN-115 TaxID=2768453 RepID=UPI001151FC5F|nr:NAD(P)-binding domain-containing protein [Streptomyces sp. SLBN-115]TQJ37469.1 cation diffusion facilitator CzcD-associated flavoprotein CzcO [Streptomyces sp. SLBN-115]